MNLIHTCYLLVEGSPWQDLQLLLITPMCLFSLVFDADDHDDAKEDDD